jgi:hypothetical protein
VSRDAFPEDPRDASDSVQSRAARSRRAGGTGGRQGRNRTDSGSEHVPVAHAREQHPVDDGRSDALRTCYVRDRAYQLRDSQIHSMAEIGRFGVIAARDLATYAYGGDRERMERDLRHLRKHGLLTDKTVEISRQEMLRVATLTKTGKRLLRDTGRVPEDQALYHGLRKPREVRHDADLYRVYQKEAARIEQGGGRALRVVLDYELKKNLNRDLALLWPDRESRERKNQIAEKHEFEVVNGKIPVPDMRIEYEDSESELHHVDLELVTREYRPRAISEKATSGFSLYTRPEDAPRLRRILDDREITAAILCL